MRSGSPIIANLLVVAFCAAAATAEAPVAVSPGHTDQLAQVEVRCPTFNWGAVAGTKAYELVVYRLGEEEAGEDAKPVVQAAVPGSATGWTPAMDQCLDRGSKYAWTVRAVGEKESSEWSTPALFQVAAPTAEQFQEALEVVRSYLALQAGVASDAPAATRPEASAEPESTALPSAPAPQAAAPTALSVDQGIAAASFTGDGSALVNLNASELTSGTVLIERGGTGGTTQETARSNLGAAARGANSDITSLTALTTPLSVGQGGTGASSVGSSGSVAFSTGSAYAFSGSGTSGQVLKSGGATSPIWSHVSLSETTGILSPSRGGTGLDTSSAAAGSLLYTTATGFWGWLPKGTDGQVLKLSSGTPTWGTDISTGGTVTQLSAGTGIDLSPSPITTSGTISVDTTVALLDVANIFSSTQTMQTDGSTPGLVAKGASLQTADLQQWQDGAGTKLAWINATGGIHGDGSGLTGLDADELASGTLPSGRLSGTYGIDITGTAANVTGTVALANGGTGASDATGARANLGVAAGPHTVDTDTTCNDTGVTCSFAASTTEGGAALSGDSATGFFSSGQIEEPRIADEIARDTELVASEAAQTSRLCDALSYRWIDLRNGSVLDCTTGKQWLKDADCLSPAAFDTVPSRISSLNSGVDLGCGEYAPGTHSDWRAPDPDEYCSAWIGATLSPCPSGAAPTSLIDSTVAGTPFVASGQGDATWSQDDAFVDVQSARYWTSTEADPDVAWRVDLSTGEVGLGLKVNAYRVWAVRSQP